MIFLDICHIYFRNMGYFSKINKEIRETGPPSRASIIYFFGAVQTRHLVQSTWTRMFFLMALYF